MDNYFDPVWEQEHPYLAAVWKKLLAAPGERLLAQVGDGLFLLLQKGVASSDRLLLAWGNEGVRLGGLASESPFVTGDDLSSLFQNAKDLPFQINEHSVPLESWNLV